MPPLSRCLRAAAFVCYGLAAAGTAALAQETSNTIGPPQLQDFSLPGQRTTPPAAAPPAPAATPPATATPSRDAPAPPPVRRDRPAAAPPAAPESGRDAAPVPPPPAAAPAPRLEIPLPAANAPEPQPQPPVATPAAAEPEPGGGWLWPALGGALVLLLGALFLLRRRRAAAAIDRARDSAREEIGGALVAAPRAPPAPQPEPAPPAAPRPWLELDIVPERAAATDAEAVVHYALTLTNQGDAEARNIRIDPRLFNAGAERDMAAFLQGPIHEESGSPQVVLVPGATLKLNGQVAMPMAEVREIEMAGRRIFVPMVAINVAYDWAGGGSGRTSRSWLVGREAETPQAKMGPFRLDLGPRIYRSVGRREAKLVRV